MDKRLTGPELVAYLRDNPTSDAMRAAADEIDRLRVAMAAIRDYPVTSALNMDAHNMREIAHIALRNRND